VTADIQTIRVVDLIEASLVSRSEKLHGHYRQYRFEARLKPDGTLICGTKKYASPSVAAGEAITSRLGQTTPGRNYLAVNGWRFWRVTGRNGETKTLADLRRELLKA
jgi:Restriction Enzyme Adenine Methylase Associated